MASVARIRAFNRCNTLSKGYSMEGRSYLTIVPIFLQKLLFQMILLITGKWNMGKREKMSRMKSAKAMHGQITFLWRINKSYSCIGDQYKTLNKSADLCSCITFNCKFPFTLCCNLLRFWKCTKFCFSMEYWMTNINSFLFPQWDSICLSRPDIQDDQNKSL